MRTCGAIGVVAASLAEVAQVLRLAAAVHVALVAVLVVATNTDDNQSELWDLFRRVGRSPLDTI